MTSKAAKKPVGEAYERIMEVASDLFFKQGYRATGINQIIEESGVAKATFYSHFKSKDELCRQYLEGFKMGELQNVDNFIAEAKDPIGRYLAPMKSLEPWLKETAFRGCPFINIASEVPDPASPLRKAGIDVYTQVGEKVARVCRELVESDSSYRHLDHRQLAKDYMLIFAGAVAMSELYHDIRPARQAMEAVTSLLKQ